MMKFTARNIVAQQEAQETPDLVTLAVETAITNLDESKTFFKNNDGGLFPTVSFSADYDTVILDSNRVQEVLESLREAGYTVEAESSRVVRDWDMETIYRVSLWFWRVFREVGGEVASPNRALFAVLLAKKEIRSWRFFTPRDLVAQQNSKSIDELAALAVESCLKALDSKKEYFLLQEGLETPSVFFFPYESDIVSVTLRQSKTLVKDLEEAGYTVTVDSVETTEGNKVYTTYRVSLWDHHLFKGNDHDSWDY